jgi:hypothetical protein
VRRLQPLTLRAHGDQHACTPVQQLLHRAVCAAGAGVRRRFCIVIGSQIARRVGGGAGTTTVKEL